ncbi:hypothetical protein Tco_0740731 [Tanacetum coccineum]
MKEKSTKFVTPTKALGEAQEEEEISPTILEAAKTLSKVASQSVSKAKSTDKGKRYRRRARSMAKKINTGLYAEDEINTGRVEINYGIEDVNTGSTKVDTGRTSISTSNIIHSPKKGQKEGKAQMVEEDIQATHKTKEQIRQEEARLKEAIKLQAQMDEETAQERVSTRKERTLVRDKVKDSSSKSEIGVDAFQLLLKPPTIVNLEDHFSIKSKDCLSNHKEKDGSDKDLLVLGAILKRFSRDELTMFDPPLSDDAIWSLPLQQKIEISFVKRCLPSDAKDEASRWDNEEVVYNS